MASSLARLPGLRRAAAALLVAGLLAGCASERGVPEFQVYREGFDAAADQMSEVIDELEAAERAVARTVLGAGFSPLEPTRDISARIAANGGFDDSFHVVDSVYYAVGATPPGAAAFRRALAAAADFNDAVGAYADGRAVAALRADFVSLGGSLGALASAAGATGPAGLPLPGAAVAGAAFDVVEGALQDGSRRAFRDAVIRVQPDVDAILVEMRDAAPAIFELLIRDARNAAKDAAAFGRQAERDAAVAEIDGYRIVMSNWVLSIDGVRADLAAVVAAIEAPATAGSALADLAATAGRMEAMRVQTRALLSEIRAAR